MDEEFTGPWAILARSGETRPYLQSKFKHKLGSKSVPVKNKGKTFSCIESCLVMTLVQNSKKTIYYCMQD